MSDSEQLVDLSYVEELAGGRKDYIHQVLSIFMGNTAPGLVELATLVREGSDWDAISKKAHFLKSSLGIVKVEGMHERMQEIETLAKEQRDKPVIDRLLEESVSTFEKARPIILTHLEATREP